MPSGYFAVRNSCLLVTPIGTPHDLFSKTERMYGLVLGLFVNRYELGLSL